MKKRTHLIIHGNVQGVSFRYYTRQQAKQLGITGWVANRPDGTVEVVAEGEETQLQKLIEWCSHGPRSAAVEKVETERLEYKAEFSNFYIKY